MGDDSDNDWLKKKPISNPIRMSLRRSNRFFPRSPDMDASLISNHGKQNQQSLAVPRIIRRTSVNFDRIKEMKFKVPAPPAPTVRQEKANVNVKKQPMGIPRPYGAARGRQSMIGPGMKSGIRSNINPVAPKSNESGLKQPQRPSLFFGPRKSAYAPSSATRKPNIVERLVKLSESCAKYDSERSILESSRIINQSTPNDPSAPRSILKQTQSATKRQLAMSRSKEETTEKPKAAKKVNFNEKENLEETKKSDETIPQMPDFAALEESTIAFTDSFRPIAFDEPKIPETKTQDEPEPDLSKENVKNADFVDEVINCCQAKWEELNFCHQKFKSLREAFAVEIRKRSQFETDESFLNKFSLYKARREDIFSNFKKIEEQFDEAIKNKLDIQSALQKYIKEEENIQIELSVVHENFKKYTESLRTKPETKKPAEEFKNPTNPVRKKAKDSPSDNLKKVSDRSKAIRKPAQSKYNSKKKNAIYNDLQQSLNLDPLGSSPDELVNTPDNTPAKRRRLSKKIQRQLNTLFEDE